MSREHLAPLGFSLLLHVGFAVLFLIGSRFNGELTGSGGNEAVESIQARIVTAAELERAIRARDEEMARALQTEMEQQRRQRERVAATQRERERRAEQQRQREATARNAESEKRLAEERARKEAEEIASRRETERRAAEEQTRQETARRQAESKAELHEALDAEVRFQEAKRSGLVDEYRSSIKQKVTRNWLPPQNLPDNVNCVVRVGQIPGGEVVSVQVEFCNGDEILKRSVEAAVWKASPLPDPPDSSVFDRTIEFVFKPRED